MFKIANFIALFLLFFIVSSCKKKTDSTEVPKDNTLETPPINYYRVAGVVQKGPFIQGSSILIQELNSTLDPTGKTFQTQTTSSLGDFRINSDLSSPYVEVYGSGYYYNELTGNVSLSPINLIALSNASTRININILTTLSYKRIKNLVLNGNKDFYTAKRIAESEVLKIFNITNDTTKGFETLDLSVDSISNGILLAVTTILQGNNSAGVLSEKLYKIQNDIESDGILNDPAILKEIRNNASILNFEAIKSNLRNRYAAFGIQKTIPDFEQFMNFDGDSLINKYDQNPGILNIPYTNLLACYPLIGDVFDCSGNFNTGNSQNAISDSGRTSVSKALKIESGGNIELPAEVNFTNFPSTIVLWFKYNKLESNVIRYLIKTDSFWIYDEGDGLKATMFGNNLTTSTLSDILVDQWYSLVIVNDMVNGNIIYYLNGIPIKTSYRDLRVSGKLNVGLDINGIIDDIIIYNKVLTDAEILDIYQKN